MNPGLMMDLPKASGSMEQEGADVTQDAERDTELLLYQLHRFWTGFYNGLFSSAFRGQREYAMQNPEFDLDHRDNQQFPMGRGSLFPVPPDLEAIHRDLLFIVEGDAIRIQLDSGFQFFVLDWERSADFCEPLRAGFARGLFFGAGFAASPIASIRPYLERLGQNGQARSPTEGSSNIYS